MITNDSNRTATGAEKTSQKPQTRRGRLPGPESGFGKRLREARGIRHQQEIADKAEVARSALARYERGDRYPSVPEFRRLCEALAVAPEYLIYGESSPGFEPTPSPIAAVAATGETEKARVSRHVLTGVLISALPKTEADAFRELIWASASQHLRDQPEVLASIAKLCEVLTDDLWPEMDQLIDEKLKTDPKFKEFVESLSDDASDNV